MKALCVCQNNTKGTRRKQIKLSNVIYIIHPNSQFCVFFIRVPIFLCDFGRIDKEQRCFCLFMESFCCKRSELRALKWKNVNEKCHNLWYDHIGDSMMTFYDNLWFIFMRNSCVFCTFVESS